jgi:hypothetical protein
MPLDHDPVLPTKNLADQTYEGFRSVPSLVGARNPSRPTLMNNFTPRARQTLALAFEERKIVDHSSVGAEHILLGILREGEGAAARVLKNLKVNVERIRNDILKELDPNFTPPGPGKLRWPTADIATLAP